VQISALLQLVFGQEPSAGFTNLLSRHIVTMEQVILAQKKGDAQAVNENTQLLYQINQEIANYLEKVNPFWVPPQWRNLLDYYVNLTLNESTAMLSGNYASDVQLFDRIQYQTLLIGDYMANGIIQYLSIRGIQA
jgi:DNA uptake protein ComE-like DNA-binding protein